MNNISNKDKWIDEVMGSTTGMQPIPHNDRLYDNVMTALQVRRGSQAAIWPSVSLAAAIVLLFINAFTWLYRRPTELRTTNVNVYETMNNEMNYLNDENSTTYAGQ